MARGRAAMASDTQATAERRLRETLRAAPGHTPALVALADILIDTDRAAEAHELLAEPAGRPDADIHILTAAAGALKALGRMDAALALYERARAVAPQSAVAEHNLAGSLGDMQRFAEAEAATRRAFAKGLDAPETWLVRARALQGLGELDAADQAYAEAIRRRPGYADAIGDQAQLVWMRTADLAVATRGLDAAIHLHPRAAALRLKKAKLLEYTGDARGAYQTLTAQRLEPDAEWMIEVAAAQLASAFDAATALERAERAFALQPEQRVVLAALCQAQLAMGQADGAARTAQAMRSRWPDDQHAIALLATAWRLAGDPRYAALCDFSGMVRGRTIDTPRGWASLADYLADLANALRRLHVYRGHPLGQSLRGGSQTEQSLVLSDDPVIRAFFDAIDGPIRAYLAGLGAGDDPLRRRRAEGYRFDGAWSVLLRPDGYHAD
ncbi:MAG TPA: tetratricopeptide repeat protein, partial [Caulobacteraceae bacterium]|nr:tetratricopeptide repeat protein [Caulobacteraceae bacterium]